MVFAVDEGRFEHIDRDAPAPQYYDGTYRRVVLYTRRQSPRVRISVCGTGIGPVTLGRVRPR